MKKILILSMICGLTLSTYSQNIFNKKTKKKVIIEVTSSKSNTLYTGLENTISVVVPEFKPSDISLEINTGKIKHQSDGNYIAYFSLRGKATITVYVHSKNGKEKYEEIEFVVNSTTSPIPSASGINDFTVSKEDLINAQKLEVKLSQYFDFIGFGYDVTSYTFTVNTIEGTFQVKVNGNKFTSRILKMIESTNSGDTIVFSDINVRNTLDQSGQLSRSILYTIK